MVKNHLRKPACNAGDLGSIPGSGRSPGEGNGYPFQYSCLENPMDRGASLRKFKKYCSKTSDVPTQILFYNFFFYLSVVSVDPLG